MKKLFTFLIAFVGWFTLTSGDDFCGLRNKSFQDGESLTFKIYYSALGIYVDAGTANFSVTQETFNNKAAYHIVGTGSSNSNYDWIFKVRDRYESYIDTGNLQPLKFVRNVDEGGYKIYENITFNQQTNSAITTKGVFKVPNCIQDVLSAIYYARNIDFAKFNVGDKIPFQMFLDNEIHSLYIKYDGKETIKTKYGKFKAIKFKPLLVKGQVFSGGEKMIVWVSDDANHIPLRIESPLTVGSIKVDMMMYRNLRYPLSSMISFK